MTEARATWARSVLDAAKRGDSDADVELVTLALRITGDIGTGQRKRRALFWQPALPTTRPTGCRWSDMINHMNGVTQQ